VELGAGPPAWTALGGAAAESGGFEQAARCHREALKNRPDFADAHWNLALALLGSGELAEGWEEYEWRWQASSLPAPFRHYPWPLWRGEPLAGRRLLVWREQGLGDELLFLSCLGDLVAGGAEVTVVVSPRLVSLVARAFPAVTVVGDRPGAVAPEARFDGHVPLGSLPRWLRRTRSAFAPGTGAAGAGRYLRPDPGIAARWAARLASLPAGRRVGVCWRSGLQTASRARHYPPWEAWAPVWAVPGVVWVNLQYDECGAVLGELRARGVTAPTVVSSGAGAVGTRSWEVESGSDWTVLGAGDRSPWFPSLRVVRKGPGPGGWTSAVTAVAEELRAWASSGEGPRG
jgi:hypothetical protein